MHDFTKEFFYGTNRDQIIQKMLGLEDYMEFWRIFWKYDLSERVNYVEAYGDTDVLRKLREKGMKLGVVTGSLTKVAEAEIAKLNYRFDSVVSNNPEAGIRQKPYPDTLLMG